jgi:hypothetical protein
MESATFISSFDMEASLPKSLGWPFQKQVAKSFSCFLLTNLSQSMKYVKLSSERRWARIERSNILVECCDITVHFEVENKFTQYIISEAKMHPILFSIV